MGFIFPVLGSFISLNPLLTMFVPVLIISEGNDMKLPTGKTLNALTVSDT